jgi:hypothetical protein
VQQEESDVGADHERSQESRHHTGPFLHGFFRQMVDNRAPHPRPKLAGQIECANIQMNTARRREGTF